jgi:YNFM family putative membrane transporter
VTSTYTVRTPPQGYLPGTPEYTRVLVALFTAGMATFVLLYDTQALLPEFVDTFGISPAQSTWALSATTASLAIALLVVGPLSDRLGRTRLIHLSLAASAVIALACAAAPSWHALLGLRLLAGIALAGLPAVATAYLREELDPSTHARAAGLYIGGTALGGMAGRLVTAPIADAFGWRWALAAAAVLSAVGAVVVARTLPASERFTPRPRRGPGGGVVATAARALSDPALCSLYVLGGCSIGALVAVFNALGFRLTGAPFGLSVGAVSLVFLVYPLGTISATASGRLADRLGRRGIMPIGFVIALLGIVLTLPDNLPLIVAGVSLLTIGFFIAHGLASGWVVARAHAVGVSTGQAAALYLFSYYVGASVFGSFGGHAWSTGGWTAVVALTAGLLVVAGALALTLRRIPTRLPQS